MVKNIRQQKILDLLSGSDIVSVSDLSDRLNSSNMTIRRDLEYFEQIGVVRRIHGGAILIKTDNLLPSYRERMEDQQREKDAIGKAAMSFISPESIVCMDAGTTAQAVVQYIPEDWHFTVITTGIMTSTRLCQYRNVDIIQVGGSVHHSSFTVCNSLATSFIKQFNADVAFLCTRAVDIDNGTLESSLNLVDEKRALVSIAKKVVLLADHTKFKRRSLLVAIPMQSIDVIITDSKTPAEAIRQLKNHGKEVIVVEPEMSNV